MKKALRKLLAVILLTVFIIGCAPAAQPYVENVEPEEEKLEVRFIDVGQGDAIWIKTPEGENLLIDAGTNAGADELVAYLKNQGVESFHAVIGTHPHEDHIGGLDKVIDHFDVQNVYMPKAIHTTKTFEDVLDAIERKGLKIKTAKADTIIPLNTVEAAFIAPISEKYEDLNNYSAVLRVQYENRVFLFTGDAEALVEKEILNTYTEEALRADVLKVGHHGSVTSTSDEFLEAVAPEYAVIQLGKDNSYGHPHKEIIEKLTEKDIEIWRTDRDGTIIITSDGNALEVTKEEF